MSGCSPSVLDGMTQQQMQAALGQAQTALIALMTGAKGVSFTYNQGLGSKAVTYSEANKADLNWFIAELQRGLGLRRRRRAIGFRY